MSAETVMADAVNVVQKVEEAPAKAETMKQTILRLHETYPNMSSSEIFEHWVEIEPIKKKPKAGYIYSTIEKADKEKQTAPSEEKVKVAASNVFEEIKLPEPKTVTAEPTPAPAEPTIVSEPTVEDVTAAERMAATPANELSNALASGQITPKTIEGIFRIENKAIKTWLGEEHCFDDETIQMLGAFGAPPIQRLVGKYVSSNMDLALFVVMVIYAHIPIILAIASKQGWFQRLKGQQVVTPKPPVVAKP